MALIAVSLVGALQLWAKQHVETDAIGESCRGVQPSVHTTSVVHQHLRAWLADCSTEVECSEPVTLARVRSALEMIVDDQRKNGTRLCGARACTSNTRSPNARLSNGSVRALALRTRRECTWAPKGRRSAERHNVVLC